MTVETLENDALSTLPREKAQRALLSKMKADSAEFRLLNDGAPARFDSRACRACRACPT
jgi:hypothetical protein